MIGLGRSVSHDFLQPRDNLGGNNRSRKRDAFRPPAMAAIV
jgi:hypothetical protein